MLSGNVVIVSDPAMVMNLAPTHTIVCLSGSTDSYPDLVQATGAIVASILLPPYEAMLPEMDGNFQQSMAIYYHHLMTKEPREFIAIMLRALYNGKNIVVYLTSEEEKMNYIKYFIEFMRMHYGITIGYNGIPCMFDISFIPVIVSALYTFNLMEATEVLVNVPIDQIEYVLASDELVVKMARELRPYVLEQTIQDYRDFIRRYHSNMINHGKKLIIPISRS